MHLNVLAKNLSVHFIMATIFAFKSTGRLGTVDKITVLLIWPYSNPGVGGGGGTLGIFGWLCVAGTLEPVTYTRASSAEFCYPILD